ncbi:MAG: zinc ribbon domain-containing protein [Planctomycetes bacterium]|nr:zinc ribbon domain-containing protein [Planctomycetota bacterium]
MALMQFTRNYTDRSNDTGFQFEFHCDKCGNGHMSRFQTSKVGVLAKLVHAISYGLGRWWSWGYAGDQVKDIFRGGAWDSAYETAVTEARQRLKSCTRCGHWVCPEKCWNHEAGLCESCAPNLHKEAAGIQAQVAREQLRHRAGQFDQTNGVDMGQRQAIASCPHCGHAPAAGAFCSQCGKSVHAETHCPTCHESLAAGSRFCASCGSPAAA